ncbi:3-methyl-2-oxobutanoate hydroxymethyltransferase [Malassezia pachydermatis]|uniref:3-methyl-2-oxobutanoate hydroxymethyltransferase n=1 Tax=Malassezia pachydermatis TaxID=77020 RepID=A0A0M9VP68_9BASI|nr:3-methyl-2-oxobutanoate hydroxymethyltransferase [Malassezia pachydermatis]KOS14119.1 3-methyl-2-oxobutanoate hydroxymethyltransferase [Malassezia pachydermatis]
MRRTVVCALPKSVVPRPTGAHARMASAAHLSESLGHDGLADPTLRTAFLRPPQDESVASATQQRLSAAARLGQAKVQGNAMIALPDALAMHLASLVRHGHQDQLRRDALHYHDLLHTPPEDKTSLSQDRTHFFTASLSRARLSPLYLSQLFPARYAVLVRVLDEVRRRMASPFPSTSSWAPTHLYDFAMHATEALWAYEAVFGAEALTEYTAETRTGTLFSTCTSLLQSPHWQHVRTTLRQRGDAPHHLRDVEIAPHAPTMTLGVHAFGLSDLETDIAREKEVLRMWKSHAHVLVLIERATPRGFASLMAARSQLLMLGRTSSPCHIVAPCPHDHACPMLHAWPGDTKTPRGLSLCAYSQLYRLPSFTRAAARLQRGDAVEEYCYVVVQRGERPSLATHTPMWASSLASSHVPEAVSHMAQAGRQGVLDDLRASTAAPDASAATPPSYVSDVVAQGLTQDRVLQTDAYAWPRLVRAPLKKGGHVTMDGCCEDGHIQRFTIAKSVGRQAYQDARKARQGDLYAHAALSSKPIMVLPSPHANDMQKDTQEDNTALSRRGSSVARDEEYVYLGPEAQYQTRQLGHVSKRVSRRAPKRRMILDATRDDTRSSRKPNRRELDEAMWADDQASSSHLP